MDILNSTVLVIRSFIDLIASAGLSGVLDILLLTILIYYILKLMKETRAAQLMKGVVFLVVVYLLAKFLLKLQAITYIIENFFQVGLIAIIIVFQPELRRILEKVGRTRVPIGTPVTSSPLDRSARSTAITEIADACQQMHESKTGALIVIERQTKISEYIKENNAIINANVEANLLCNIFFNKAPLHDGAVIIRDNRIYAASCYLPMPENDSYLASELGTRHRAAIGLSEKSDALIIVVSEETGKISVAFEGQLTRDITKEDLINILNKKMPEDSHGRLMKSRRKPQPKQQ